MCVCALINVNTDAVYNFITLRGTLQNMTKILGYSFSTVIRMFLLITFYKFDAIIIYVSQLNNNQGDKSDTI